MKASKGVTIRGPYNFKQKKNSTRRSFGWKTINSQKIQYIHKIFFFFLPSGFLCHENDSLWFILAAAFFENTKFDDLGFRTWFFWTRFCDDFCMIQFLAALPHQINWTNSLTFNILFIQKLKASANGTSFEMPKNEFFFRKNQFRSDLMSQCNTACSNACATPQACPDRKSVV